MRVFYAMAASLVFSCYVPVALAADASVAISSPQDGAKFSPKTDIEIVYDVALGEKGDHTHLYVDNNEAVTLRGLKGTHELGTLSPGKHEICIKVVNKAHTPIGAQQCVNVTVG